MQEDGGSQTSDNFFNLCFLYMQIMFLIVVLMYRVWKRCLHIVDNYMFALLFVFLYIHPCVVIHTELRSFLLCLIKVVYWTSMTAAKPLLRPCVYISLMKRISQTANIEFFSDITGPKGANVDSIQNTHGKPMYVLTLILWSVLWEGCLIIIKK